MLRSQFGSHYAGHGMAYSMACNEDEVIEVNIPNSKKGCTLSTDHKNKDDLAKYCREQSGEVITYNLKDLPSS